MADKDVYIGPYIEVIFEPEEKTIDRCKKQVARNTCPIKEGEEGKKFCQECGLDLRDEGRFKTYIERPDIYQLSESSLIKVEGEGGKNFEIVRPNYINIPDGRNLHGECDGSAVITPELIEKEIAWMKNRFADEIEEFERIFEEVEIKWGAFVYWD